METKKEKLSIYLEKPITFYPQLAKALGGIEEAVFVQQLYYWSDKSNSQDGWIYKSKKEWEEETALTRYQLDRIRKKLKKEGIIETKLKKANGAPTLYYRLNIGLVRNSLMEKLETNQSISWKTANPITENTTENTTDINIINISSNEEILSSDSELEKKINRLMGKFKTVNPTYYLLFARKPQREALKRMLHHLGEENLSRLLEALPEIISQPYAPKTTTPRQLEENLGKLMTFIIQKQGKSQIPKFGS